MTLLLEEYTKENTISPMGECGVVTHPEVCARIEDCISSLSINEDFDVNDVLGYLHEIYGGPDAGPMQWVNSFNLENALETHLCPSWSGKHDYDRPVGVDYDYDWQNYITTYWRVI